MVRLHDPVLRFARQILVSDAAKFDDIAGIDVEVTETIQAAKAFALRSPLPGRIVSMPTFSQGRVDYDSHDTCRSTC